MTDFGVFDRWSGVYDRTVGDGWIHDKYNEVIEFLASQADSFAEGRKTRLLDIGAGTGNFLSRLANPGIEAWAIEPSSGMRGKLSEKCPAVCIVDGELPELPMFDDKFDCIVSSYVIHHICHDSTKLMIDRICKNLKPGGMILLADVMFESRDALEKHISDLKKLGMTDRIDEIQDEAFQFVDNLSTCLQQHNKIIKVTRFSFYAFCIKAV